MKRSPLRKVSKKRVRHNLEYQKAKREYMKDHEMCEVKCCRRMSQSLHHKKGRGIHLSNPDFFMATCNFHHNCIEQNRSWAREQGYLLDRIGL